MINKLINEARDSDTEWRGGMKDKEMCHGRFVAQHRPQQQMPYLRLLLLLKLDAYLQRYNQVR